MKKVVAAVWCVVLLSCVIVAVVVLRRDCSCDSEKAGVVESAKTTKAEELKQPAPVSEDPALIPNDAMPPIAEKTVPKVLPSKPSRHIRIPVELSAVPQTMLKVAGEQDGNNYFARSKAMRTLGKKLLIEEVSLLYILMNRRASDDPLPADQLNALKNEAADLLLEQKVIPSDLANNLMAMYSNKKHDVVWRDHGFSRI